MDKTLKRKKNAAFIKSSQKVFVCFTILVFLIIISTQLLLNSNFVRNKVEQKVQKITSSSCTYDSASLTGINSVTLKSFSLGDTKEVSFDRAKVSLDFQKTITSKSLVYKAVEINGAKVTLNLDELAKNLKHPQKSLTQPTITKIRPRKPVSKTDIDQNSKKTTQKSKPKKTVRPPTTQPLSKFNFPNLSIKNAQITLTSKWFNNTPITLDGISIHTKKESQKVTGKIQCKSLLIGEKKVSLNLSFPFSIKGETLTFHKNTQNVFSLEITTTGQVKLTPKLPFHANFITLTKQPSHLNLSRDGMLSVDIQQSRSQLTAQGQLINLQNSRAKLSSHFTNITPQHRTRGSHLFTHATLTGVYNSGLFHIPSYTLHSDEISFTGNALGSTQKADAICRIVSNTETKEMITKFALGSLISSKRNFLIPLDTQDRFYRDIYLSYSPTSKIEFFAHPDKGWTSLDSGLPFLQSFITRELWTEEQ